MEQDLLKNLNLEQRNAVTTVKGPLIIFAGAGSGKTKALTTRIAYLIKHKNISPRNILAVTFTNKAANEMKERIFLLIGQPHNSNLIPHLGTFHSICIRILRKHILNLGYDNYFVIYDTADQQILIKHILADLGIDSKQFNPRAILNFISNAKNQLITPEKYYQFVNNYFTEKVEKVYRHYQKELKKANALDFDDIIMKTVELFKTYPEILDKYQEEFKYISVDEYQDTNHAQYVLTNLLAAKYHNLCVIGDSDQSIYSFRGANIQNILDFEKDYPDAKFVFLEQNYRSTQIILDAAYNIIIKNKRRKEKKLWTDRTDGEKITLKALSNERAEGEYIAEEIIKTLNRDKQRTYNHFVILYRTNAQSRVLEESFLRNALPYKIIGGIKFYERKEIKDLISYLRVIQNPNDTISLLRIINTPPRKIGSKTLNLIQEYSINHDQSFWESILQIDNIQEIRGQKSQALQDFTKMIQNLQKTSYNFSISDLIKHVLDNSGYKRFLDDGTAEGEARLQNVYELISVASKYQNLEPRESLSIFLEEIALTSDLDNLNNEENAITLMTVHSAKGLEFPIVFIVGLEDGLFPHSRSILDHEELEEERRLMYVAITRSKDKLYLLYTKSRMLYGESRTNPPSQFILDIPVEHLDTEPDHKPLPDENFISEPVIFSDEYEPQQFQDGNKVIHPIFGEGVVVSIKGGVATIAFKSKKFGLKKLALSVAPLRKM